jgi:3-hydroxyisobutyrate dehydrogenase-like beta-hydroxyacid dehydrogenase
MSTAPGGGHDPVGWIGIGRMGEALVERLLNAGVPTRVWNRTAARTESVVGQGAQAVETAADLAGLEVVFSTVSDDDALLTVALGPNGLLTGATGPRVWVDCSTVSVHASDRIAEAAARTGTALVAAPVSGNANVVRSGNAVFAVSGPPDAIATIEPIVKVLGASYSVAGPGHEARVVKLCTNILVSVITEVLAEALVLAEKTGVSRAVVMDFINNSVVGSAFTRYKSAALVNLDLTPTFSPEGQRKDIRLALAAAADHGVPMPVVSATEVAYSRLVHSGLGDGLDFASLILQVARDAGIELSR